jgi:LysR family glycine cleavage system transcriptional activator
LRRLPPLNPLKAFEAAGRHLSLSAAAAELHVTPAAVSRQVKLLENTTGVILFERHHRAVKLTPMGKRYLKDITPAFDLIDKATAGLRVKRPREMLNIQAYTTMALRWLIPRLPSFRKLYPGLDVQITASLKPVSFDIESIDAAVKVGTGDWPELKATRLLGVRLTPVCAPALLERLGGGSFEEALRRGVLLHSLARKKDWAFWLEAAGYREIDGSQGMRFESSSMAYQAAIEGIGFAMAQTDFVETDIAQGRLVAPCNVVAQTDEAYYFVVPAAGTEERKVRLFREWLSATCAQSEMH